MCEYQEIHWLYSIKPTVNWRYIKLEIDRARAANWLPGKISHHTLEAISLLLIVFKIFGINIIYRKCNFVVKYAIVWHFVKRNWDKFWDKCPRYLSLISIWKPIIQNYRHIPGSMSYHRIINKYGHVVTRYVVTCRLDMIILWNESVFPITGNLCMESTVTDRPRLPHTHTRTHTTHTKRVRTAEIW